MTFSPGTRIGPYEIVGDLGVGGMGEVYRARDPRLNREVALKALPRMFASDPDRMARFEREAQLLASLNHPNIAALYGFEDSGTTRALVMELVEGPTLAKLIAAGRIPLDEALTIAKQIAEALEYAHDRAVVHRDLKPANIKVTPDGAVKVLDFGLAKALGEQPLSASPQDSPTFTMGFPSTHPGMILGTAAYMAPEQAMGKPANRRSDVWSFGVVLFEMLTGKRLFTGETPAETIASVMHETPPLESLPARTPPPIRNLILRCLEKDSRRRLQHIGEARIALEDALSGTAGEETPLSARPASPLRLVLWTVAGLLFISMATLSFVHLRETPAQRSSIRFYVPPPEKSLAAMFKLSPDGRYLAIVAFGGGQNRLWVRPLDLIEAHELPGTDDARYPFWSPDSAFVAFFAQGKLKRIALAGGPPQTLCDAPNGRGGAWNSDGVILFAPSLSGGLYSVPAQGGLPAPVTKVEISNALNSHRFPEFLPDGIRFTYVAQSDKPEANGIYAGSLEGTPSVRLLPDLSTAAYADTPGRTGHLMFLRENTLMAQPFDPGALRAAGGIFPLAEPVGVAGDTGSAAFSVSRNGMLAFRSGGSVGNRELVWMDRKGVRLEVLTKKAAAISSAALSPDEKTIAFTLGQPGAANIWLQNLTSGAMSQFTLRPGSNRAAVWSPNGRGIVFASTQPSISDIYQKPASGGKEELVVHAGVGATTYDWSPDGKSVVYSQYGEKTNDDLWLLPVEGDRKPVPYLQDPSNEVLGSFSPNGRWMAYVSDESGPPQVYVQTIPAGSGKWQVSTAGGSQPRWRRDGRELYYVAPDRKLMAVPVKRGAAASGSFEAGAPQPLFGGMVFNGLLSQAFFYQPSADGERFMVTVLSGGDEAAAPPITVVVNWLTGLKK